MFFDSQCFDYLGGEAIFVPKDNNASSWDNVTRCVKGIYALEKNIVDVVTLGTSHMLCGFDSIKVYEDLGIISYNYAMYGQFFDVAYHFFNNVLKMQSPKLVLLDVSTSFYDDWKDPFIIKNLDSIPYLGSGSK